MTERDTRAEVNIHIRARSDDREIIDRAAGMVGANRSQFMLSAALRDAKNILLDQTTIHADTETFQKIMDWMDAPPSGPEIDGMKRLVRAKQVG